MKSTVEQRVLRSICLHCSQGLGVSFGLQHVESGGQYLPDLIIYFPDYSAQGPNRHLELSSADNPIIWYKNNEQITDIYVCINVYLSTAEITEIYWSSMDKAEIVICRETENYIRSENVCLV